MQINRLFEMVHILLAKKTITAKELAEHFEVSQRTVYRDIDTLSAAGIPVYTNKGKGGGISLLDNFVLDKSVLSEREQVEILSSLQGLNALNVPDVEPILKKLAVVFDKNNTNWIDVDFSHWGSDAVEREKFHLLKSAILNRNPVVFDYVGSNGDKTERTVEPIKLLFKGQGWYIYGFCRSRNDFRMFKITRIKNLRLLSEGFEREVPQDIWQDFKEFDANKIKLVLRMDPRMEFRLYDEFEQEHIVRNPDGSFDVTAYFPDGEWIYSYILSFGSGAEVLEPLGIRENIKRKLEECLKKYS